MKKIFKCKNLFLVTFLAIAGFFSATAIVTDGQENKASTTEKAEAKTLVVDDLNNLLVKVLTRNGSDSGWFANANYRVQLQVNGWNDWIKSSTSSFFDLATDNNNWNVVKLNDTTDYWYQEVQIPFRNYLNANNFYIHRRNHDCSDQSWNTLTQTPNQGQMGYEMYENYSSNSLYLPYADFSWSSNLGYVYKIRLVTQTTVGGSWSQHKCVLYQKGHTYTFPTTNIPAPNGYRFNGWYTDSDCTISAGLSLDPSADTELYAGYVPDTYDITYNKNGGTINSGEVDEYTYGVGATLPTDVTKENNDFEGWYNNSSFTGDIQTSISTTDTGNKNYYAKWNRGFHGGEVFFVVDKGSGGNKFFSSDRLRLWLWDSDSAQGRISMLSPIYDTEVYKAGGSYPTYRVTIPDYPGTNPGGWIKFIIVAYTSAGDSDTTLVNEHIAHQTGDLSAYYWRNYSEWTMEGYTGSNMHIYVYNSVTNSALYGFTTGNVCYLDVGEYTRKGSGYLAIYFFGSIGDPSDKGGTYTAWAVMSNAPGKGREVLGRNGDFAKGLWEFTVPYPSQDGTRISTFHRYILVELGSGKTEGTFDDKAWQSSNLEINEDTNMYNCITMTSISGTVNLEVLDSTRTKYFGYYFNSLTDPTRGGCCDGNGATNQTTLKDNWALAKAQLPLKDSAQTKIKKTVGNQSGSEIEQAVRRYDYVYGKYHSTIPQIDDFAKRTTSGGAYSYPAINSFSPYELIVNSEDSSATILIIVASSISLLSITALSVLMVKKRKSKQ